VSRIGLVLFVLAAASFACQPRGARVRLDPASCLPRLVERVTRVLGEPGVSDGFDELLNVVTSDPTVRDRGTALLGTLAADPAISQAISQLMTQLARSPEIKRIVTELMASHPGIKAGQADALIGKRFETTWASPPIHEAWLHAWHRLRTKLDLGPIPAVLEREIAARFEAYMNANSDRWGERILELNGGQMPSAPRATELYLDHAWSEVHIRELLRSVLANPRVQHELLVTTQRLIQLAAVGRELETAARIFVSDVAVQQAAVALMRLLLQEAPPAATVELELDRLLQQPPVAKAINQMLAGVLAVPEVPKLLVDAFDHLVADPQLAAEVRTLFDGW
jgi:hypothetical protein